MIEDNFSSKPCVSVIVLDFNGHRYWPPLLEALSKQSFKDFELVAVVNGQLFELPRRLGRIPVRLVNPNENLGFAEGCNVGARLARGEFVVLLNNDTVVSTDWLETLVKSARSDASIGAVCSKVVFFSRFVEISVESESFVPAEVDGGNDFRKLGLRLSYSAVRESRLGAFLAEGLYLPECDSSGDWVWTCGKARFWVPVEPSEEGLRIFVSSHPSLIGTKFTLRIGKNVQFFELKAEGQFIEISVGPSDSFDVINNVGNVCDEQWMVTDRGIYERDSSVYSIETDLQMACGCSLLIRRSCLEGALFDPEFFAYSEDTDLSLRLRKAGWRMLYEPKSVVRHHGSGTARVQSAFQVFHATRNRFWVIAKHAPWKVVWRVATTEMTNLKWYAPWMNEEFSLSRLKRETWFGFVKRLWRRLCDSE